MQAEARLYRLAIHGVLLSALAIAGCSGNASNGAPCDSQFFGSAGAISGVLVSPASGATGVPTSPQTLVFNAFADYSIVLESPNDAGTGPIQTTPTALPSGFPTNPPVSPQTGSGGYFAVSVPALAAGTTYAVGTLSDHNQCADDYTLRQFGTFSTK
jgi:hypothetical protein